LKIYVETNQTSYMLIFVFIYWLKSRVEVSHVNSTHCKNTTYIFETDGVQDIL